MKTHLERLGHPLEHFFAHDVVGWVPCTNVTFRVKVGHRLWAYRAVRAGSTTCSLQAASRWCRPRRVAAAAESRRLRACWRLCKVTGSCPLR